MNYIDFDLELKGDQGDQLLLNPDQAKYFNLKLSFIILYSSAITLYRSLYQVGTSQVQVWEGYGHADKNFTTNHNDPNFHVRKRNQSSGTWVDQTTRAEWNDWNHQVLVTQAGSIFNRHGERSESGTKS